MKRGLLWIALGLSLIGCFWHPVFADWAVVNLAASMLWEDKP